MTESRGRKKSYRYFKSRNSNTKTVQCHVGVQFSDIEKESSLSWLRIYILMDKQLGRQVIFETEDARADFWTNFLLGFLFLIFLVFAAQFTSHIFSLLSVSDIQYLHNLPVCFLQNITNNY